MSENTEGLGAIIFTPEIKALYAAFEGLPRRETDDAFRKACEIINHKQIENDALTAERDRLRADNEQLRAACKDAPNVIYSAAILLRHFDDMQAADTLVAKADRITAALSADGGRDGSDGERGSVQS